MILGIEDTTLISFSAGVIAILVLAGLKEILNRLVKWNPRKFWHIALIAAAVPLFMTQNYKYIGGFLLAPVILYALYKIWRWKKK